MNEAAMTDSTWILVGISLTEILLITLLLHFTPSWSRPEHLFSFTVPAAFRESSAGRGILRRFRRRLWLGAAVAAATALALLWQEPAGHPYLILLPTLVLIAAAAWAYLAARAEVEPAAVPPEGALAADREAAGAAGDESLYPTTRSGASLLVGGLAAQLTPFALLAAMGAYLAARWESIPERFATHWNGNLQPDAWADKDPWAVASPLLMGAGMCLLVLLMAAWMSRGLWASPPPGAEAMSNARRRAIGWLLLGANLFMAVVFAAVAASPLLRTPEAAKGFVVAILVISLVGPLVLLVAWFAAFGKHFMASHRRSEARDDPHAAPYGDRLEDRFWKAGLVYYNPGDPALWVEKRFGIGYTLNFARPAAWWFMIGVVVLPVGIALLAALL